MTKGGGRYLCAAALLTFILSTGLFLSACGGGGSGGGMTPDPGNGNGGEGPAVTVSFGKASYDVTEGESVTVEVTLSADPERTVTIPVTVDSASTAVAEDYSSLPASVTFASGETTKDITVAATDDTADDDDETVILNFGTLPDGVTAGTTSSTTVTINDAPDPCEGAVSVTGTEVYDVKTADNGQDSDPDSEGVSICGDGANNFIRGGSGPDNIWGLGGNDEFRGREGDDGLHGGEGIDTVVYFAGNERVNVSLEDEEAANDGHGDTDTLVDIENVTCIRAPSARIAGDDKPNRISGCGGGDLLIGLGGDDTFGYSSGNDYYDGGEGTDTLDFSSVSSSLEINLALVEEGASTHPEDDTGSYGKIHIKNVLQTIYAKLETTDVTVAGEGNTNIENIIGGTGNDTLTGDADSNRLDGYFGNDILAGGGGADTLIGGSGTDTLTGGPGNDIYRTDSTDTVTEATDGGEDTLYYTDSTAIAHSLSYTDVTGTSAELAPENIETVYGTTKADVLRPAKDTSDVTVIGGPGEDTLIGGEGDNTLIGCGGKNIFYSNTGSDTAGDVPYAYPRGGTCDAITTTKPLPRVCGNNTFVLVYESDTDSPSVIDSFTTTDEIILAGFGDSPAFTAAAATVSDLGSLTTETGTTSEIWADLKVGTGSSARSIAYIKSLDQVTTASLTTKAAVLADALQNTSGTVTADDDYDTGCDEIQ